MELLTTEGRFGGYTAAATPAWSRDSASYDLLYKVLLIGESGVGKSNILLRQVDDIFSPVYMSTVGVDFRFVDLVSEEGKKVKLQVWDTAGQERFQTITKAFYRGSHGVAVVFDVTDERSFARVSWWLQEVNANRGSNARNASLLLIGNKCDLTDLRAVDKEDAVEFAERMGVPYIETSAKTGSGVIEAFQQMTRDLVNQHPPAPKPEKKAVRLTPQKPVRTVPCVGENTCTI